MKLIVLNSYDEVSLEAAKIFIDQVNGKPNSVLCLATGSTPVGMYRELARANKAGGVDFAQVTTVNLDEYYPISPEHPQSYRYFMNENLFNHINIPMENTHVPDGAASNAAIACATYDRLIEQVGGIDLALLGVGNNGHIAFNEPGETLTVGTHQETLTENTREANSRFFNSMDEVPTHALTMGLGSILSANKIVILATGKAKADAVKELLNDKITTNCPATLLKVHKDVTLICDRAAFEGKDL